MIDLLIIVGLTALAVRYFYVKSKRDEDAREAQFRATMLALEDKAKREGTYVGSYFDDWSDKSKT